MSHTETEHVNIENNLNSGRCSMSSGGSQGQNSRSKLNNEAQNNRINYNDVDTGTKRLNGIVLYICA